MKWGFLLLAFFCLLFSIVVAVSGNVSLVSVVSPPSGGGGGNFFVGVERFVSDKVGVFGFWFYVLLGVVVCLLLVMVVLVVLYRREFRDKGRDGFNE